MSKRAEQKSIEWQIAHHPMAIGGDNFADLVEYFNINPAYIAGYEQAEKDTIERACEWLFSHLPILVNYYDEDIHEKADRSEFIKLFRIQMEEEISDKP